MMVIRKFQELGAVGEFTFSLKSADILFREILLKMWRCGGEELGLESGFGWVS